ncbi:MAG: hypothetical protein R2838_05075 [Caldilineaceae bacterium]
MGADGHPRQQPALALQELRGRQLIDNGAVALVNDGQPLPGVGGDVLELHATLTLEGAAAQAYARAAADGDGGMPIEFDGRTLRADETAVDLPESHLVRLHVPGQERG